MASAAVSSNAIASSSTPNNGATLERSGQESTFQKVTSIAKSFFQNPEHLSLVIGICASIVTIHYFGMIKGSILAVVIQGISQFVLNYFMPKQSPSPTPTPTPVPPPAPIQSHGASSSNSFSASSASPSGATLSAASTSAASPAAALSQASSSISMQSTAAASSVTLQASPSINPERAMMAIGKRYGFIPFYKQREDKRDPEYRVYDATYPLNNFFEHYFTYRGLQFKTAEGAFQYRKAMYAYGDAIDPSLIFYLQSRDGDSAFRAGQTPQRGGRIAMSHSALQAWNANKDAEMLEVLRCKFRDPALRRILLATGNKYIVEHRENVARNDYWTDGNDGSGQNRLGVLEMTLRNELGGVGILAIPHELRDYWARGYASITAEEADAINDGFCGYCKTDRMYVDAASGQRSQYCTMTCRDLAQPAQ